MSRGKKGRVSDRHGLFYAGGFFLGTVLIDRGKTGDSGSRGTFPLTLRIRFPVTVDTECLLTVTFPSVSIGRRNL